MWNVHNPNIKSFYRCLRSHWHNRESSDNAEALGRAATGSSRQRGEMRSVLWQSLRNPRQRESRSAWLVGLIACISGRHGYFKAHNPARIDSTMFCALVLLLVKIECLLTFQYLLRYAITYYDRRGEWKVIRVMTAIPKSTWKRE